MPNTSPANSPAPAQPLMTRVQLLLDQISETNSENIEILNYLTVTLIGEKVGGIDLDKSMKPGVEDGQIGQIIQRLDLRVTEVNTVNQLLRTLRDTLLA